LYISHFDLYEIGEIVKRPSMKHIQFARDDINALANRLNNLIERVVILESSISKKK